VRKEAIVSRAAAEGAITATSSAKATRLVMPEERRTDSITRMKREGEAGQPCRTPLVTEWVDQGSSRGRKAAER
jgi:hypothetical protein